MQVGDIQRKTGIIAIVDDDEPLCEALGSVMKAADVLTDTFASEEEYLYSAKRQDTMCLILDVRLPGMSGIELQRRLRDGNSQVPIIFINSYAATASRNDSDWIHPSQELDHAGT
jgi:FixJ family two-component response regulator